MNYSVYTRILIYLLIFDHSIKRIRLYTPIIGVVGFSLFSSLILQEFRHRKFIRKKDSMIVNKSSTLLPARALEGEKLVGVRGVLI